MLNSRNKQTPPALENVSARVQPVASANEPECLPRATVVAYGLGVIPCNATEHGIAFLVSPLYNVILSVNPALIGGAMTSVRLLDLFLDPLVSHFSDNSRSRWGRRKPIWIFGGVLSVLSFAMFFFVPTGWSATQYSVYLIAVLIAFELGRSPMTIGYVSMLPELSSDTRTRTVVLGVQLQIRTLATFGTVWALPFAHAAVFTSVSNGFRVYAGVFAALSLVAIIAVAVRVRERFGRLVALQARVPFLTTLREIGRMKPLLTLLGGTAVLGFAGNLVNSLGFYLLVYYVYDGSLEKGAFWQAMMGTTYLGSVLLLSPLLIRWCQRFGQERVFIGCSLTMVVASISKAVCIFPGATWSLCIPSLLMGVPWSVANVILNAKAADLTDWDELQTGHRREGMISMVIGWGNKAILSFVYAAAGFLLVASGFESTRGDAQAPYVFEMLLTWYVCLPILFTVLALLILRKFPITQQRALVIRTELELRRGQV